MYRFVLRPRWIAGHVLVGLLVVLMVNLGLWQLRRHDERAAVNAAVAERSTGRPAALPADPTGLEWQLVEVRGTYVTGEEVLVRNRSLGGQPGSMVLTPLALDDGRTVAVARGWVPLRPAEGHDGALVAPPPGEVVVRGVLRPTERREGFGPADPPEGRLAELNRVDLDRLDQQLDARLYPAWVQLLEQEPAQTGGLPAAFPLPAPDSGPHLGYAGQWFIFAVLAVVGWGVLIRQSARGRAVAGSGVSPPGPASPEERGSPGRSPRDPTPTG